jgi:hypothetical protein
MDSMVSVIVDRPTEGGMLRGESSEEQKRFLAVALIEKGRIVLASGYGMLRPRQLPATL